MDKVKTLTAAEVLPAKSSALSADAPRIGVSVSLNFPGLTESQRELMRKLTLKATTALVDLGSYPVILDATGYQLPNTEEVTKFDGIVVLGGGDIDPELAGHPTVQVEGFGIDRRADEHSIDLINRAVQADMPLTAICRGSQLLNVALGGTVIQDLDPGNLHRGESGMPLFLEEKVVLARGSKVAQVYGAGELRVQSGHHQAVQEVAEDLRVAAVALDGTIEATEHRSKGWVVGVQWHPEHQDAPSKDLLKFFSAFLTHVQSRMSRDLEEAPANL